METRHPLESDQRRIICQNTFDEVIEYYNANEELFLNFKSKYGINVWFLNHFRTYMQYRNLRLENEGIKSHLNHTDQKPSSTLGKLLRIFKEIFYMVIAYRKPKVLDSEVAIISNASDQQNGKNKRFGDLSFEYIHNRILLDIKQDLSKIDFVTDGQPGTDSIFIRYLFSSGFLSDFFTFNRSLKQLRKSLERNLETQVPSYKDINRIFWKSKGFYLISYLRYKSLDSYLSKTNLKGILISDENSPQQLVIQYAAQKHNIKTFGFQHGNIHQLHPAYIFGNYRTKPILPTLTFTWGSYFTELLQTIGGYPANQVRTIGRLLPQSTKVHISNEVKDKENILLYASQPQRDPKIRAQLLKDILWCAQQLNSKYQLVIRPHPRESDDRYFLDIADEVGFHDFIIDRESDLQGHLEICQVLMLAFSTVGTEYIPYYKPLIVLDYLQQDLINWIGEGVGIPARSREDILNILSKEELNIDKQSYDSFINKYYITGRQVARQVKETIYESI